MDIRSYPRPPKEGLPSRASTASGNRDLDLIEEGSRRRRRSGSREEREQTKRKEILFRTLIIGSVSMLGLALVTVYAISRDRGPRDTVWKSPDATPFVPRAQKNLPPTEDEALKITRSLLNAERVEDLRGLVRLKGVTLEDGLKFLKNLKQTDGKVSELIWIGNTDANGIQQEAVDIAFEQNELTHGRRASLTPDHEGRWQIDLAALMQHQGMPWGDLIAAADAETDLRVYVLQAPYYNGAYSDEKKWMCFQLVSKINQADESELPIYGYCPRDGRVHEVLVRAAKGQWGYRAILRVKKSGAPKGRQMEIVSVLAEGWVESEVKLDEQILSGEPPAGGSLPIGK